MLTENQVNAPELYPPVPLLGDGSTNLSFPPQYTQISKKRDKYSKFTKSSFRLVATIIPIVIIIIITNNKRQIF